jgi:maleate isomerase
MDIIYALEMDLRKPVITSSAAFFWEIFCRLGIFEPLVGRGSLLASLDKGP